MNAEPHADLPLRDLFEVPDDVVFMNCANIGPRLKSVSAAARAALDRWGRPWTVTPSDWFEDAERVRAQAARIMGSDPEGIALVPAVSYAMSIAARNLPVRAKSVIVVVEEEFPSNYYAWKGAADRAGATVRTARRGSDGSWTDSICAAIDGATAVVSVPVCHWTDGAAIGVDRVARRAREVGAALVIDASQSLGVVPFSVSALDPDFVVSVGYKWLLGPYGVGYLYAAPRWRAGFPLEETWFGRAGSEDFARLVDYKDIYRDGARRFDAGEQQNLILLPMSLAALTQVTAWPAGFVAARLGAVTSAIADAAATLGIPSTPAAIRSPHIIGLRVGTDRARAIATSLRERRIFVAVRGDSLRVAPHMHVTSADIARFIDALRDAVRAAESSPSHAPAASPQAPHATPGPSGPGLVCHSGDG